MAVGVPLPAGEVQDPGGLHLEAGELVLGALGPHPGDCDLREVAGDLVGLAFQQRIERRCDQGVLGGHDGEGLGVVDHDLDEAKGLAVHPAGADAAL